MILIRIDSNNRVLGYHENPNILSNEEREEGIMVDSIPEVERRFGKNSILLYDSETKAVYVEYLDRPLTQEESILELKDSIDYLILQNEGLV